MRRRSITKWAGLFGEFEGERLPSLIERRLLERSGAQNPVLVYGPAQRSHLISFLPALMTHEEIRHASYLSKHRRTQAPWRLLSVGSAIAAKGFDLALRGLAELKKLRPALDWTYTHIGDGEAAEELRELSRQGEIADRVRFAGALKFSEVQKHYAEAHILIMPGTKEGWPKTIAEAWAHGVVPVAASAGLVPWILQGEDAGLLFEPTPRGLADILAGLLDHPEMMTRLAGKAIPRAAELSLESFENRLERVLTGHCGLT
jgi:glycosyltransferase involved in cell wall biosynthesis